MRRPSSQCAIFPEALTLLTDFDSLEAMVEDEAAKAYAKKKFVGEIQKKGASGGKNYYKNVQKQRQRR